MLTVNSVAFDVLDEHVLARTVQSFGECGRSHVVHFLAAHPTVVARSEPGYRALLTAADLVVPDGAPIAVLMRASRRSARRVTSTDGFLRICADGLPRDARHFFLGGADEAVAGAFRSRVLSTFPELRIAGHVIPPFRPYEPIELLALTSLIQQSGADIVWVGVGAPKQEVLAHQLRSLNAAPVIATIGATFDFVAGTKARAPACMRAVGLEWLYRLCQEPRRLWRRYVLGNAQFLGGVLRDACSGPVHVRRHLSRRPGSALD